MNTPPDGAPLPTPGATGAPAPAAPQRSHAVPTEIIEIAPGDPAVWAPRTYDEWAAGVRTRTFLGAWTDQMVHERGLRSLAAKAIFGLIGVQIVAVFGLLVFQGLGILHLDIDVLKVLIPSVLGDVFGLGFVVTKYLFSQPLRHGLDTLVRGKEGQDGT